MARVKQVNIGGTAYDVADKVARNTVADEFSTSKAYAVGDYCIYDNTLYKCTTAKTAGAWSASYFASTTVAQELQAAFTPELLHKDTVSGLTVTVYGIGKIRYVTIKGTTTNEFAKQATIKTYSDCNPLIAYVSLINLGVNVGGVIRTESAIASGTYFNESGIFIAA